MSAQGRRTIAVAGNPNCGKTTVFNGLTGSRQRIGNWPGVTVEKKEGTLLPGRLGRALAEPFLPGTAHTSRPVTALFGRGAPAVNVVDLPGIYSMAATSEDEIIARDFLLGGQVDLVVNVVDASNIQRNLFLTLQLLELRIPVLVVLNMMDMAGKKGIRIQVDHLSEHLGCPVVAVSAIREADVAALRDAIHDYLPKVAPSPVAVSYPPPIERAIAELSGPASALASRLAADSHWVAVKLIEGDTWVRRRLLETGSLDAAALDALTDGLAAELGEELDVAIADARYAFIHGLSRHVTREAVDRRSLTDQVDRVVMNRIVALPIFLLVMYAVFWFTMSIGGAFIDFFDIAFGALLVDGLGALLENASAPAWLTAVLADGIGAGITTVATFIPIIFAMFVALSILEDSGYMARAAYVMDRFMRTIGLPGKSFVPMMVGFGCTVPAIMGTRTLETRRDRFITIFMAPNMSCGARLPVYALFAAAFFGARSGLIVFTLYVAGIIVAVFTGMLLKLTLFRGQPSHFVMELPPYHVPRLRYVAGQAWNRLKLFLVRAGVTITLIVTVLSVLSMVSFGPSEEEERSVLAHIGKAITPVFGPLGITDDNWPATVGLFTGIFAKEAIVGSLSAIYGLQDDLDREDADVAAGLLDAVRTVPRNLAAAGGALLDPLGLGIISPEEEEVADEVGAAPGLIARLRDNFTPTSSFAYLLFVLIYFPCAAALAAAIREMGIGLGWVLGAYSTSMAWSVATLFYQFATVPVPAAVAIAVAIVGLWAAVFTLLGRTVYVPTALESR